MHGPRVFPIRSCFGWGLPSVPCYQETGGLLPHHFTFTAKTRLYISVALSPSHLELPLAANLPCEVPTFLPSPRKETGDYLPYSLEPHKGRSVAHKLEGEIGSIIQAFSKHSKIYWIQ